MERAAAVLKSLWWWLRAVSEDSAYEQYLARLSSASSASFASSASEFYLKRLEHKYSRPTRCC